MNSKKISIPSREAFEDRVKDIVLRLLGVLSFIAAAVLAKFMIFDVLDTASKHVAPHVMLHSKWILAVGVLPLVGLLMILLGKESEPFLNPRKYGVNRVRIVFWLLALGAGFSVSTWLDNRLSQLGYTEERSTLFGAPNTNPGASESK